MIDAGLSSGALRTQPWQDHTIVFVGGLHRSGTTLLADTIASAPGASGLSNTKVRMDEGQFLQNVYPIGRSYGGPTRWALNPASHLTAADATDAPDAARRLWESWSPYWNLSQRMLVEKTPLNLTKTTFLQEIFPKSKFVIVTRHPITQSLAVRKWSTSGLGKFGVGFDKLVQNWLTAHETFQGDAPALARLLVIRYEHLVSDPRRVAAELSEFLQTDVSPDPFTGIDPLRFRQYGASWSDAMNNGGMMPAIRALTGSSSSNRKQLAADRLLVPRASRRLRKRARRVAALGYDLEAYFDARLWSSTAP